MTTAPPSKAAYAETRLVLPPGLATLWAALARRGSFTLAAKDLFLTQSAVSHAIKSLEQELGCHLFQRVGRSAVLTHAGERW